MGDSSSEIRIIEIEFMYQSWGACLKWVACINQDNVPCFSAGSTIIKKGFIVKMIQLSGKLIIKTHDLQYCKNSLRYTIWD